MMYWTDWQHDVLDRLATWSTYWTQNSWRDCKGRQQSNWDYGCTRRRITYIALIWVEYMSYGTRTDPTRDASWPMAFIDSVFGNVTYHGMLYSTTTRIKVSGFSFPRVTGATNKRGQSPVDMTVRELRWHCSRWFVTRSRAACDPKSGTRPQSIYGTSDCVRLTNGMVIVLVWSLQPLG